jgi:uncharacterized protein DUF3857
MNRKSYAFEVRNAKRCINKRRVIRSLETNSRMSNKIRIPSYCTNFRAMVNRCLYWDGAAGMGTGFRFYFLLILTSLLSPAGMGQSKPSSAAAGQAPTKTDAAQQAIIVEQFVHHVAFESDGTDTHEVSERIRVQSDAGVQALAVLSFAYTTGNQSLDVDYVRVRKPDGTVITTPAYNIQDMPADVTRVAPMYSDIHEKHVAVRGLGVGGSTTNT